MQEYIYDSASHNMKDETPIRTKPHLYSMLCGYEWVDDYIKLERLTEERRRLKQYRNEIENRPLQKKNLLVRLKKQWEAYQATRIEKLGEILKEFQAEDTNPFEATWALDDLPVYISFEEIQAAAELLNFDDAVTAHQNQVDRRAIESQIRELETEINKLKNPDFFMFKEAAAVDIRQEFVKRWRDLQFEINAPCGPTGVALSLSPENEQYAWHKLVGEEYVDHGARYRPHDGK